MPRLAAHLHELEADVSILATDWYLTLFATSMPAETAVRVWDALFNEGSKVLFRISLALLKDQEEHFMQYSNAGDAQRNPDMTVPCASLHHSLVLHNDM
jgi:hypothetical protein